MNLEIEREPPIDDTPQPEAPREAPKFTRAYDLRARHVSELPPDMPFCERALVGALLIDCGKRVYCNGLSGAEFADRALGRVFDLLMSIDGYVDLSIAHDRAIQKGLSIATGTVGLGVYLASLMDILPDLDGVEGYVTEIKRGHIARVANAFRTQMAIARARGVNP